MSEVFERVAPRRACAEQECETGPYRTLVFFLALSLGVAASPGEAREQPSEAATQTGIAIYYSDSFQGRPVANGEILDQRGLTAAHNGYALGTRVRVTNLSNGKSVVVKINDRMGPDDTLLIDVTRRAAEELDFIDAGRTTVRLEVVE